MENVSNALIMAAGVLIGVLVLSLAIFLFVDFGGTAADVHIQADEQRLIEFNSKFTTYETTWIKNGQPDTNTLRTIYDIVTVAGYAKENNNYYKDSNRYEQDYKIEVILGTQRNIQDKDNLDQYIKNYLANMNPTENDDGVTRFTCTVSKHDNGRVKSLVFKEQIKIK